MKTKSAVLAGVFVLVLIAIFSFRSAQQGEGSMIALLNYQAGKDNDDNFVISYGNGTVEKVPFIYKPLTPQSRLDRQLIVAGIYEKLAQKGYHFIGMGEGGNAVFQKK